MPIYAIDNRQPVIKEGTWIAPNATLIGNITIGCDCYIGFGAVIRADFGSIVIGDQTLVEENVVIHTAGPTVIGNRVIIGHLAMLHDTTIQDGALIGMQSMVCAHSVIGQGTIIAEQSLVRKNQKIPAGKIYAGSPAAYVMDVTQRHRMGLDLGIADYMDLLKRYHTGFREVKESGRQKQPRD